MLNNSKPNQPIILLETDIVGIDGQPVRIPTTVVFQLSPYPTVVIELVFGVRSLKGECHCPSVAGQSGRP